MKVFNLVVLGAFFAISLAMNLACGSSSSKDSTSSELSNSELSNNVSQTTPDHQDPPPGPPKAGVLVFLKYDLNKDGKVNADDLIIFMNHFKAQDLEADFNDDLIVDGADLTLLLAAWTDKDEITTSPDLNNDGRVDGADLTIFLSLWGTDNSTADFNGDGVVDGADLAIFLASWGSLPASPGSNVTKIQQLNLTSLLSIF
jgi:hypothetical protein